ncbi:MAG TPA: hypothetical protein VEG39_12170 [Clostridia bacterium]|nr:hypothetical protein [Clostridia bacterium]
MFELKFYIVGGYIKMDRKIFLQEMLGKDSSLRQILNWRGTKDFAEKHPIVGEPDKDDIVTIDFNYTVHVELGQPAIDVLSKLKSKYRGGIRGKVCCRWLAGYSMSNFIIDLDSDDDTIQQGY